MNTKPISLSTGKTLGHILAYFGLFLAGELLGGLPFDLIFSVVRLPYAALYTSCRMVGSLAMTMLLFWLYTTKVLHRSMADFGICLRLPKWSIALALVLPGFVVAVYSFFGQWSVGNFTLAEGICLVLASVLIALKSGLTEEVLFRGYILRLLESRWGRPLAIFLPSLLFGLVHLTSMTEFSLPSILLLLLSGTMVGILFSLAACRADSIAASALIHGVWNLVMITGIVNIRAGEPASGAFFCLSIPGEPIWLTGGEFGPEASLIALAAYALGCAFLIWGRNRRS